MNYICKKCYSLTNILHDEELCTLCHDKWLDKLMNNKDLMAMVRLNRFKEDIGLGG